MMPLFRMIRGFIVIALLVLLLIPTNIAQICSLLLLIVSRRWYMRWNMEIAQQYCGTVAKMALLCGNKLVVTGNPVRAETTLVFANHQSVIDIIMIWVWALPVRTIGWIKWFAKDSLKHVPGMGWGLYFVNTLFVKRDWAKDAESVRATFSKIRKGNLPTWLVIFPEGTRMKPSKLAAAQEYARRKGIEVFDHVLMPRGKGIHASLQGLEGLMESVYDLTLRYEGQVPSMTDFFLKGGYVVHLHAVRYDIKDVPTRERDLNAWLVTIFSEKNKRIAAGL